MTEHPAVILAKAFSFIRKHNGIVSFIAKRTIDDKYRCDIYMKDYVQHASSETLEGIAKYVEGFVNDQVKPAVEKET